jgi:hypothetical protein
MAPPPFRIPIHLIKISGFRDGSCTTNNTQTGRNSGAANPQDWSGLTALRSPEFSGRIDVSYTTGLARGSLAPTGNLYATTKYVPKDASVIRYVTAAGATVQDTGQPRYVQPGLATRNLHAMWTDSDSHFSVGASLRNVTDTRYRTTYTSTTAGETMRPPASRGPAGHRWGTSSRTHDNEPRSWHRYAAAGRKGSDTMLTEPDLSPTELREVLSRQQITQLLYRYCRAVDRIDAELGYSLWHEDAQADYGRVYRGSGRGFIDFVCDAHRRAIVHSHQITNIIMELEGDRARTESYVLSAMRLMHAGELKQITTRGRYLDRWSRRDERWGIDQRVFVNDFDEIRPVTSAFVPPTFSLDRSDPSYAFFAGQL